MGFKIDNFSHARIDGGVKNYRKITPVAAPTERMPAEEKGTTLQVFFCNKFIVHKLETCPTGCTGEELFSQSAKCAAALR